MLGPKCRVVTIVCGVAIAMLSMPALSEAGLFGCWNGCAAPTYAVAAPACATRTCGYMPTVVYRALYQPAVVRAYRPVYQPVYQPAAPCNTCTSYAVTTYRPPFAWAYQGRLVPYTTYRPVYRARPVVAYSGCNWCAAYSSCSSCSPCVGSCGAVTYETPASSCSSCAAPATFVTPAPGAAPATNAAPPQTFQKEAQKPVADPESQLTPSPDTRFNSMPSPLLPDPKDRTALRTGYSTARVALVALPVQAAPVQDNGGWQPARD